MANKPLTHGYNFWPQNMQEFQRQLVPGSYRKFTGGRLRSLTVNAVAGNIAVAFVPRYKTESAAEHKMYGDSGEAEDPLDAIVTPRTMQQRRSSAATTNRNGSATASNNNNIVANAPQPPATASALSQLRGIAPDASMRHASAATLASIALAVAGLAWRWQPAPTAVDVPSTPNFFLGSCPPPIACVGWSGLWLSGALLTVGFSGLLLGVCCGCGACGLAGLAAETVRRFGLLGPAPVRVHPQLVGAGARLALYP